MPEDKSEHEITFFVNNEPVKTKERELTGAQIKSLAGIPADYQLFEVQGQQSVPVADSQVVKIHENLHFRAIPAGTFGTDGSSAQIR